MNANNLPDANGVHLPVNTPYRSLRFMNGHSSQEPDSYQTDSDTDSKLEDDKNQSAVTNGSIVKKMSNNLNRTSFSKASNGKPITLPPQSEDTLSVDMLSKYEVGF